MKIIFFGTPQFAVPSLATLIEHPAIHVKAVVTQPDKKRGRGSELIPSPIKTIALQHALPVWQPKRVKKDSETLEKLKQTQSDAFVVVAYGQILSQEILDMPHIGCINGHGSILPKYRGAAPIQWSIVRGEPETGITTMLMDAGMDTGPMLLKAVTPIHLLDNAASLAERLSKITANLLVDTLLRLEQQTITPDPQDSLQATYAPLINKDDYCIDWSRSAFEIHNQIRGFYPNCVTNIEKQTLKIKASIPLAPPPEFPLPDNYRELQYKNEALLKVSTHQDASAGTIIDILKNYGPVVQTGNGFLLLLEVQLSGRRSQSGWDFVNGTRIKVGTQLG